jgi:hypothetical protein
VRRDAGTIHPLRSVTADASPGPDSTAGGLARYVAAATLARTADGGAVVAIVLLVTTSGGPGWLAGLLGASITAPHLLGPFIARSIDTARDGRIVIAIACLLHGAGLAAAVLLYPIAWPGITAALLITAGLVGPILTGGISSRLPAIAGPDRTAQRRAQGWDVATYGIGGTIGPSVVAVLTATASATLAGLVLAAATFVAAVVVRFLPPSPRPVNTAGVPTPITTLRLMVTTGPLRRTLYLTVIVALSVAVLPVTVVASTGALDIPRSAAGILTAAYGLGGLAASAAITVRPLPGDADRMMTVLAGAVAGALAAIAATGVFWAAAITYAIAGALNSYFFAATLAARSEYSPVAARGQVFVWIGALKITAGSAGTALAGALVGAALHLPLAVGIAAITIAVLAALLDRRFGSEVRAGGSR